MTPLLKNAWLIRGTSVTQVKFGNDAVHDGCERCLAAIISSVIAECALFEQAGQKRWNVATMSGFQSRSKKIFLTTNLVGLTQRMQKKKEDT
jgi:hypothetical protein